MEELTHHFTVLVGSNLVPFTVPARSICAVSNYFDNELDPYNDVIDPTVYPDAQPYYVYLPTEEPEIFELFLRWMLNLKFDNDDCDMPDSLTSDVDMAPLVDLYLLADKLGAPDCMRYVISYLWVRMARIQTVSIDTCILLGERVGPSDALHMLLRDMILNNTAMEDLCLTLFDRAPEFAQSLLQGAFEAAEQSARADWGRRRDLDFYLHQVEHGNTPEQDYVEMEGVPVNEPDANPSAQRQITSTPWVMGGQMELPTRVRGGQTENNMLRGGHMELPTRQR